MALSDPLHDQGQTSGQKTSTENRRAEREVWTGSAARMRSIEQIAHASLHHQNGQREEGANAKPPGEGSHRCPRQGQQVPQKPRLSATLAEGSQAVKQAPLFSATHRCFFVTIRPPKPPSSKSGRLSVLDGEKSIPCRRRYRRSQVPALRLLLS